jgi:hypothetical protein
MQFFLFSFCHHPMTTSIEELKAIVAQSMLDTQVFKAQLVASQEAADRFFAESKAEDERRFACTFNVPPPNMDAGCTRHYISFVVPDFTLCDAYFF